MCCHEHLGGTDLIGSGELVKFLNHLCDRIIKNRRDCVRSND